MIIEDGRKVQCPRCGSTDVEAVMPFDYIKVCRRCKKEFMSKYHN